MDRKVIRVLKESIDKLNEIKGVENTESESYSVNVTEYELVKANLRRLLGTLENKMLLKTTIVQPVYGYWRDDNENREYVLDREEMQREFDDKLNRLEEEGLLWL